MSEPLTTQVCVAAILAASKRRMPTRERPSTTGRSCPVDLTPWFTVNLALM
jgi:hypothetical protein